MQPSASTFKPSGTAPSTSTAANSRRFSSVPVAKITSCCFGGDDLRDLYVTTRQEGLSAAEHTAQPLAGALLRLDVGVSGLPTDAFAG